SPSSLFLILRLALFLADFLFFNFCSFFFFIYTSTSEIYTLSLHDALPIWVLLLQYEHECCPYYNARMLSKLLIAASFQLPTLFASFLGQYFSFWVRQLYDFPNYTRLVSLTNHYRKK